MIHPNEFNPRLHLTSHSARHIAERKVSMMPMEADRERVLPLWAWLTIGAVFLYFVWEMMR